MDYPLLLSEQLTPYLKSLRKESGLSQARLGQLLGVGQARMADIENNPGSVSVDQMMKVLTALDARLVIRQRQGTRSPDADQAVHLKTSTSTTSVAPARSAGALKAVGAGKHGKSPAPAPAPTPVPARKPARKSFPKGSW